MGQLDMDGKGTAPMTCSNYAKFIFKPENVKTCSCSKCKLVALLEEKIQQLEAHLCMLWLVREDEVFPGIAG